MIFIPTHLLKTGMILAKDIFEGPMNIPLLAKGRVLTEKYIERMKARNVAGAYVESKLFTDVVVESIIEPELRSSALADIRNVFDKYQTGEENYIEQNIENIKSLAKGIVWSVLSKDKILVNLIDLKCYDDYTYSHSLCVSILSVVIGISLGFTERQLNELALCALLHDIGKMDVPIGIIKKPDTLSEEEYDVIRKHPVTAVERLKKNKYIPDSVLNGIMSHHEKYDGTGYPHGLKGEDIPYYARILAIADVYDALTSNRPYRNALFPSEAIEYMMGSIDVHFDYEILKAFLKNVAAYPLGTIVTLSNNQAAIVVKNNSTNTLRPVIRLINSDYTSGNDIDLLNDNSYINITIVGMGYDNPDFNYSSLTNCGII